MFNLSALAGAVRRLVFFTKSQLSLFEELRPTKGTVDKNGHIRRPGFAKRHVKHDGPAPVQSSLFGSEPKEAQQVKHYQDESPAKKKALNALAALVSGKGGPERFGQMLIQLPKDALEKLVSGFVGRGLTSEEVKDVLGVTAAEKDAKPEPKDGDRDADGLVFRDGRWHREEAEQAASNVPPKLDLPTVEHDGDTWHVLSVGAGRDDGKVFVHLSSTTRGERQKNGVNPIQINTWIDREKLGMVKDEAPEIVEYTTRKGKTLRGIVRTDLTLDEAKAIDEYTFKLNGGYFIREKHLTNGISPAKSQSPSDLAEKPATVAKKARRKVAPKQDAAIDPIASTPPDPVDVSDLPGLDYSGEFNPSAIPAFGVKPGVTKTARRELNREAAALANSGRSDFTDEEMATLRQYSGWGGCGQSLNEFYTPAPVAAAVWKFLKDLGMRDGAKVLEPSCGAGVFLHTAPSGVTVTGIEMDATSSKVADALHGGRHEVVNSGFERFATTDERQFDAVVGNPPFGPRGDVIAWDKPDIARAEQYFVDASMDKCVGGGVVALVLPTGIMDNANARWLRERMLRKGDFLGAVRMPNTAFEASHTEVTTDVIFLRKRDNDVAQALMTVDKDVLKTLGVWDDDFLAGSYFTDGRGVGNVCGSLEEGWRAKAGIGNDITVNGSMSGVPERVAAFASDSVGKNPSFSDVLAALDEDGKAKATNAAKTRPYQAKAGDMKMIDGVAYVLSGKPPRWHRVDELVDNAKVGRAAALAKRIDILAEQHDSGEVDTQGDAGLAGDIRAFIAEYGNPGKDADLMLAARLDRGLYRLMGAVKPDGSLSDLVEGRKAERIVGSFETAAQSLAAENGEFTPLDIASRWGKGDSEEALEHLYAVDSYCLQENGKWTTADNYLSGFLWPKLDAVRAALAGELSAEDRSKLEGQATALEAAIDPKILDDVEIRLNDGWIPITTIEAWFKAKQDEEGKDNKWVREQEPVKITFENGIYKVVGGNAYHMDKFAMFLNRSGLRRDDRPMIDSWNEEFKNWLCGSEYRGETEDLYNRKFKGFVAKTASNEAFEIPGLNTDGLKDYQYGGLRWALNAGKGIIAADVGLGKTVRALMLARMMKMTGKAKRPVIVVPKSVLANWFNECEKWFPGSKVATIGESYTRQDDGSLKGKMDGPAERARKLHDIQQNDYDFILISRDSFSEIDLDPVSKGELINKDFWTQRGDSLGNKGDKQLNDIRTRYEQAQAGQDFRKRNDALWFNELGIDGIIADEGHSYKNLYAAKTRFGDTPKFLGGQGQSKRARDMNLKTQWLRERTGGKNVYLLTATPTKNSPLEIYSMLCHVAPEAFESIGIKNSEDFLDRFCKFATDFYLDPTSQTLKSGEVVSGFKNLDELRGIMSKYIDRTTAEQVGLILPSKDERSVLVDMNKDQLAVYDTLRAMAEEASKQDAADGEAHIFSIMDKMAKAATDLELLDPVKYKGAKSPKLEKVADNVLAGIKNGGQVVFSDYLATHTKLVDVLVKRGIPRDQIAIINAKEAEDSSDRQNIANAFNSGKIKVVIGNTATMGEGINLQMGTTDIHHVDLPWEPASVQQRNGRGVRQGNLAESVRIHTYMVKGTFDAVRWNAVAAKKDWQDILWNGSDEVENLGRQKFSSDEMKILLSANPDDARAKFDEDKAAATQRYQEAQRSDCVGQFRKFRELQASFGNIKDKGSKTANSLRMRMESMKTALKVNKFFTEKDLLNSDTNAVISPVSGHAFYAGRAFDVADAEGAIAGRYVVTGVTSDGRVKVRMYGEPASKSVKTTDIEKLAHAVPFAHSEVEEAEFIQKQMESAISEGKSVITNPKMAAHLPEATTRKLYDQLQEQIRGSFKAYKDGWAYGANVPLIHPETGAAEAAEGYGARKRIEDGMHVMLPGLPEHREAAMRGYIEQERGKFWRKDSVHNKRGNRTSYSVGVNYPGRYGEKSNAWHGAVKEMWGEDFVKEANEKFRTEQMALVTNAETTADAIRHIAPLLHTPGSYSSGAEWDGKKLGIIYAKAKANGDLEKPVRDFCGSGYSSSAKDVPAFVFGVGEYGPSGNLRDALYDLAKVKDKSLAAVMATHRDDILPLGRMAMLKELKEDKQIDSSSVATGYRGFSGYDRKHHPDVLAAMRHIAEKHPEIGDMKVSELFRMDHSVKTDNAFGGEVQDMTVREALAREVKHD